MDRKELLKRFGKNVKIARVKSDLTQEKLAEKMNKSQIYISTVETGNENMSLCKIQELADFIGTDISCLLDFS